MPAKPRWLGAVAVDVTSTTPAADVEVELGGTGSPRNPALRTPLGPGAPARAVATRDPPLQEPPVSPPRILRTEESLTLVSPSAPYIWCESMPSYDIWLFHSPSATVV